MHSRKFLLRVVVELIVTVCLAFFVSELLLPLVAPRFPDAASRMIFLSLAMLLAGPVVVYRALTAWAYHDGKALSGDVVRPFFAIMACGVLLTTLATIWMAYESRRDSEAKFDALAERVKVEMTRRMANFEYGLKALRGLHEASEEVSLKEFRNYCEVVNPVESFPGAMGQGFIRRVQSSQRDAFLNWAHENLGRDFKIKSAGSVKEHDNYYVICHIEPLARNQAAWGLDVGSERNRREAADKAIQTGLPTLTAKINLVQDQLNHNGFLYYLAVYETGMPRNTAEERDKAFMGWAYMPITSELALEGIIQSADEMLDIEVYDDTALDPSSKLFCGHGFHFPEGGVAKASYRPQFIKSFPEQIGGRHWTVQITSNPNFDKTISFMRPEITILFGGLLTFLVAAVVWNMGSSRRQAIQLAETMTVDLKTAKDEAEQNAHRFTAIFINVPVGVALLDADGRVLNINPEGLKLWEAYSRRQLRGCSLLDQVPDDGHAAVLHTLKEAVAGRDAHTEFQMIGFRGTVRLVEMHAVVVGNVRHDGASTQILTAMRDITKQRRTENELREARSRAEAANQTKSEFLANMSHEIRTPMTAILGYTDLLAEEQHREVSLNDRMEYINTIRRNGEHLLMIINDILDLSKIEAGKMTVESVPTRIDMVVREVMELMQVKAAAKGLALSATIETKIPKVIPCDPIRLRQILVNLVGNAIKFTEIGCVRVQCRYDSTSKAVQIAVEDSGIGMTEMQMERLFQAFVQADNSMTRRFGGTGLGLRISKRLAEILGGDITITSEIGIGSTFCVSLFIDNIHDSNWLEPTEHLEAIGKVDSSDQAKAKEHKRPLQGMKILLAEDGPDNIRLISFHLRKAGAEVDTVENGKLLIEKMTVDGTVEGELKDPSPCDVVLTDMQMPEMDGYEAARLLRAKGARLPIVALTAHAMSGDLKKCLDAGCSAYATKPIDRDRLIKSVQRFHPEAMSSTVI
ncbi:response regulator [Bremerella cremea]|uniref:histidine kinase n=1 Tax=Bremerella cremea TaxID=1031537 RepID=A0A368KTZ6_9BACT|nr:CHASE domain-containing protein [Bremerella cremea]RCS53033.1 response regulator [Bremerella cremea]